MNPLTHPHPCMRAAFTLAATMLSVGLTTATLAAAGALLSSCGGGDAATPPAVSGEPVAVLDIDVIGSIDAAAQEAAAARGAPGEAEPVHYVVRARRVQQAEHAVAELTRLGFSPVRVAGAHDDRAPGWRQR
jgi:hypothetical protein